MADQTEQSHILIAGAGIGGLVLAQCLRAKDLPFTVFERDRDAASRSQGWAIALHTILADLVEAVPDDMPSIDCVNHLLPLDLRPQLCFYDSRAASHGQTMEFIVESGRADEVGYGAGRVIRANRDRLRDWLCTNIEVLWGKQVVGFEEGESGVSVEFSDGTTAKGSVLVGADGARSAVRRALLPDAELVNVAECFLTGEVTLTKEQYEDQMRLAHSSYVVLGAGYHVFVGLSKISEDAASADYYWDLIWHDDARIGSHWIDSASAEELYDYVLRKTAALDPELTKIIRLTRPQDMKTPPLVLRDLELENMPVSRVTLLGDAAHAMVPFRGEGGCHAIEDAIKLAKVLVEGGSLEEYQKEMLLRGSNAVRLSRAAGNQAEEEESNTDARTAWGQPVRLRT